MREDTLARDQAALAFIRSYHHKHGYPPSRTEIAAHLGMGQASQAQRVIERLERDGYIQTTRTARGIKIVGANTTQRTEDM